MCSPCLVNSALEVQDSAAKRNRRHMCWKGRREIKRAESGLVLGNLHHGLGIISESLGPSSQSLFLPFLGLSSPSHCDNWPGSHESSQSEHSKTPRSPWVALDVTELVGTLMVVLAW